MKDILIKEQEQIRYIYGYRRMKTLLRGKYGIVINHKALRRIMKETGTQAVIRRRKANAMYHTEGAPLVAENRLNRDFAASIPKHKYVTDITYIPIPGGMTYLSVMLDLYNREVVSYVVSKTQDASLSCQTVENLARKTSLNGAMIHSDQGCALHQREIRRTAPETWRDPKHEPQGQLLGQCGDGEFFLGISSANASEFGKKH